MFQQIPISGIHLLTLELDSPSTIERKRLFSKILTKRISQKTDTCKKLQQVKEQEEEPIMTNHTGFKQKKRQSTLKCTSQLELTSPMSHSENIPKSFQNLENISQTNSPDRNYETFFPLPKNNNRLNQAKRPHKHFHKRQSKRLDTIVQKITQKKFQTPKTQTKTLNCLNAIPLQMKQSTPKPPKKSVFFYRFKLACLVEKIKNTTDY
ncbi:hypothetical protein M0813_22654 [Anaeramoeba flamelloides]|uniref:Uncharacterized protein n=1 Tax=Anaeramoeba flamelloides TaxID=1746091 RepID=A0ABQ8YD34_9EUKA|nr:hypothetical protein M0813_22654 [Anaeramoeba flamelloides]